MQHNHSPMLYAIKKLVSALLGPLAVSGLLLLAGAWRLRRGHKRSGRALVGAAIAICYLGATPLVGGLLIAPLENPYPPYHPSAGSQIRYIVVLGSYYSPSDEIPVTASLGNEGVVRITEGIRLYKQLNAARLVLSGGAPQGQVASALGYQRMARELGIPDSDLIVLDKPRDTAQEAQAVAATLGTEPFLLVTSASHMPRAMRLMAQAGVRAIAAPTGQRAATQQPGWRLLIPRADGLQMTERALHEYAGLFAMAFSSQR